MSSDCVDSWRALYTDADFECVCKVIKEDAPLSKQHELFMDVMLLAQFDHPNIIKLVVRMDFFWSLCRLSFFLYFIFSFFIYFIYLFTNCLSPPDQQISDLSFFLLVPLSFPFLFSLFPLSPAHPHTFIIHSHRLFQGVVTRGVPKMIVQQGFVLNSLKSVLQQAKMPGTDRLLHYCEEIANGMMYLSQRTFVHRSLAAQNIFVNQVL